MTAPEAPDTQKLTQSVEELRKVAVGVIRTAGVLRCIGYGLLILSIFDYAEVLVQANPRDEVWLFQTIGNFVERVPVPLLGFGLVFYGGQEFRKKWEIPLLKILSWLTLLAGIFYLLLIPLETITTVKLDRRATTQVEQGVAQFQQVREQLDTVTTPEEMEQLIAALNQGRAPNIESPEQLTQVKEEFSEFVANAEEQATLQAQEARSDQRIGLLKNSVKWNLGALVSAVLFFIIWKTTRWVR